MEGWENDRLGSYGFIPSATPGSGRAELGIFSRRVRRGSLSLQRRHEVQHRASGFHVHGTVHGVTLNDSGTFGGKLTAWHLPRKYNWQPQIGLQLDFTRFTADLHPQLRGADGTWPQPGFQLGSYGFTVVQDMSVDTLAANLMFRYPV